MSLRARLLAGMVLVAVVLVATAFVISRATESYLVSQVDDQLANPRFRPRPDFTESRLGGGESVSGTAGEQQPALTAPPSGGFMVQSVNFTYQGTVSSDGTQTSWALPNVSGTELATPAISWDQAAFGASTGEPFTVESSDSTVRYRVSAFADPNLTTTEVFVTALPLTDVDNAISRLMTVEIIATLIALTVLSLVTWWVIRLGVQPIKRMTKAAAEIAAGDLSHRVPVTTSGTEAAELGTALNTMMTNIEGAFDERAASEDRLRRFIADASHELRTPVATVRGYAELYRVGGIDAGEPLDDAMRRTEQEAVRMGNLVDDMLQLARLDQGRTLEHEPVQLDRIVEDAALDARARAPQRPVTTATTPAVALGDEEQLRQVVTNLVTNALVHTPDGTPIELQVRSEGSDAVIEVHDDGPGMTPEAVDHAFERFYRADPSRSRRAGGAGLGLAIVQAIVAEQGGVVALESVPGSGTTVRVRLPSLH